MERRETSGDVFAAVSAPIRRELLRRLETGEQPMGALADRMGVSLSAVSQQLSILREAGLVVARKNGRKRMYKLVAEPIKEIADWAQSYERFWSDKLQNLGIYLEENS